jgi:hypothetical protein
MSGHLRFCFAAVVLIAALPISPASSNPFAGLFNAAPAQATAPTAPTAPAAAEDECLPRPGKSTAAGQRWVYRFNGHRKCWFQAAQGIAMAKKQVRHGAAKPPVAVSEENEAAPRKQKAVADARAELLSAPAEASQPKRLAPEFKPVDAASVLSTGAGAFVPPAPVERRATDQLTPDHATPHVIVVKTRLATAPAPGEAVAETAPLAAPVPVPVAEAADDGRGWMVTLLGVLLMALGLVSVLGSSANLREAVLLRG